jgi:hypothetical protein
MLVRAAFVSIRVAVVLCVALQFAGCTKKRGEAIVLEKEHIAVAETTPTPAPGATPQSTPASETDEPVTREMAADEIEVDSYVMKKEVRGTSKDPRAGRDEKWLVKVRLVEGGRWINIHTDRAHYDKVKIGDRIKVRYKEGSYTSTVWSAEIED